MFRQVPSRNHRSKELNLKKFLQICLLLVVSVWLLYQVIPSYDKKEAYNDRDLHMLGNDDGDSQHEMFKFGRKDLPSGEETDSTLEARTEGEENEEIQDVDDEMAEGGDDLIDEQDQDDIEEGGVENIEGESEMTEKHGDDEMGVFGDDENTEWVNGARERSFQGDNVASAVAHNARAVESVSVNGTVRNLDVDRSNTGDSIVADEHGSFRNEKISYNSTVVDPTTSNATNKTVELEFSSSRQMDGVIELQTNSTLLNKSLIDSGSLAEVVDPKNETSGFDFADVQNVSTEMGQTGDPASGIVMPGVDREKGNTPVDLWASLNIENKAMSGEEAVLE